MKKILIIICSILILIVFLVSCGNSNFSSIQSCIFYEAGVDDCSTLVSSKNKYGIKEIVEDAKKYEYPDSKENSGLILDDSDNVSTFVLFYAVVSLNKFDIYVMIDSIPNDVEKVKLEVDNDIKINNIDCKSGNIYDIDVTGTKIYFILSLEIKENTIIKIKSISDKDNEYILSNSVNGKKRANEIEVISAIDFVKFDDSFNTFTINETDNIKFKSIFFGGQSYTELDSIYSFNDYNFYEIRYVYKIKDTEINCDKIYEKRNGSLYHIGSSSETMIYDYE